MTDKRRTPRTALNIYVNKIINEEVFMCRATDVSTEGIYLSRLIEPDLDGKRVGVEFSLTPRGEVLWATGEIVREGMRGEATGSGIRFTSIPDAYRGMIREFVDAKSARATAADRAA